MTVFLYIYECKIHCGQCTNAWAFWSIKVQLYRQAFTSNLPIVPLSLVAYPMLEGPLAQRATAAVTQIIPFSRPVPGDAVF